MCNTNSQIKFETTMSNSSLCDYGDAYILAGRGSEAALIQVNK